MELAIGGGRECLTPWPRAIKECGVDDRNPSRHITEKREMRIAVAGAGVTTPLLLGSLLTRSDSLSLESVTIYDRNRTRVEAIHGVISFLRNHFPGVAINLTYSISDLRHLRADCGIISIRPGLEIGRSADELCAKSFGLLANETVGAAGLVFACRAIPAAVRLAGVLTDANPHCLIINFTNPSGLVTAAMQSAGIRSYGVCSSAEKATRLLLSEPDSEPELQNSTWRPQVFGLNHLSWTYSLIRDETESIQDILCSPRYLSRCQPWFDSSLPLRDHALINEYLYYYYMHDAALLGQRQEPETRGQFIQRLNKHLRADLRQMDDVQQISSRYLRYVAARKRKYMGGVATDSSVSRYEDDDGYSLPVISLIEAAVLRRPRYCTFLSTENTLDGLPSVGFESTRRFEDGVPIPTTAPPLAAHVWSLISQVARYEQAALAAIEQRDFDDLVAALALHPLVPTTASSAAFLQSSVQFWPHVFRQWSHMPTRT
jgi:6-phospho-beta-glucosidase